MRWRIGEGGEQAGMTRWRIAAVYVRSVTEKNTEGADAMTTWQLFVQALGYLMLLDLGGVLVICAVLLWHEHRESRETQEIQELERMLRPERYGTQ